MRPGITSFRICDYVCTALFYAAYLLFSLIYIPVCTILVTIAALLCGSRRTALRMTRHTISAYGRAVTRLASPLLHLRVQDRSNHRWGNPCLVICNHQSIADIFLLAGLPHECVFLSNRWPFRIPVLGFFARLAGYLSMQGMPADELFEQTGKLTAEGVSLISFPEGTRTQTGELGPFHATPFRIAQRSETPIIPVCISGNYQLLPPKQPWIRRGNVYMHVLPVIDPESYRGLTPHQLKQRAYQAIASELKAIEGSALCS